MASCPGDIDKLGCKLVSLLVARSEFDLQMIPMCAYRKYSKLHALFVLMQVISLPGLKELFCLEVANIQADELFRKRLCSFGGLSPAEYSAHRLLLFFEINSKLFKFLSR
jgi:hypothetical protein